MVQSNKILTVSYGTFSCTLEGFDNPFAAMQSIAEYFRDLAADDRYFGAEPPQPDAQMLHQIAEREGRRRVDARVADDSVVLRQMNDSHPEQPTAPDEASSGPDHAVDRLARIHAVAGKARVERDRTNEEADQGENEKDEAHLEASAKPEDAETAEAGRRAAEASTEDESEPPSTAAEQLAPRDVEQVTAEETIWPEGETRDEDAELASLLAVIAAAEVKPDSGEGARDEATSEGESAKEWIYVEVEDDDGTLRTIKMSRAEFESALAKGELEEIGGEGVEAPAEDAILEILSQTSLPDADAAALAAELAAVEQEPQASRADADQVASTPSQNSGDRTVTRLLDETNAQMGEPEGHRRRTAIQHLRAAVLATQADGGPRGQSPAADASLRKFRDDLQKVVRPSRADTAGGEAENPLGPLVLVSSQRVDARVKSVRPVREDATPADISEPEGQETFLHFAAKLGARELPDLLEAAAAYSKIVEGEDGATRPVLIRRATEAVPAGSPTREEGLKSFGQLLRSGRIRKIDAGRFALSDDAEIAERARTAR